MANRNKDFVFLRRSVLQIISALDNMLCASEIDNVELIVGLYHTLFCKQDLSVYIHGS